MNPAVPVSFRGLSLLPVGIRDAIFLWWQRSKEVTVNRAGLVKVSRRHFSLET